MSKVKIAMIGAGNIANAHITAYKSVENAEVYALCDINESRLNETGDLFGIERRYTDVDTMLRELPELDGKLLYSDSSAAWFQLDNNMSTLQNTLNALEKSGCTVTAYEDVGLTLDSRADSWLLIVRN